MIRRSFLHSHNNLKQSPNHEHVVVDRADWEEARRIFLAMSAEEARHKLEEKHQIKIYEFCVILADDTPNDEVIGALLAAGCDDGTIVSRGLCTHIRFSREAQSLEDAIISAIADIRKAKCIPSRVVIEADSELLVDDETVRRMGMAMGIVADALSIIK
jgi:hypothetical protein